MIKKNARFFLELTFHRLKANVNEPCLGALFGSFPPNWDIGISLILALDLGYWLTEIGILGYQ